MAFLWKFWAELRRFCRLLSRVIIIFVDHFPSNQLLRYRIWKWQASFIRVEWFSNGKTINEIRIFRSINRSDVLQLFTVIMLQSCPLLCGFSRSYLCRHIRADTKFREFLSYSNFKKFQSRLSSSKQNRVLSTKI